MDKNHEVFDDYIMQFDLNDKMIKYKYNHSYRVMKISREIAKYLNFDEDGIFLAEIIGLFHDIGRFKQWTKYNTFNDLTTIDHGQLGCEILFKENLIDKLDIPENSEEVISKAIYNHDKFKYNDKDYDEIDKIFCKIIRDADKIDILNRYVMGELFIDTNNEKISEKVKESFFNHQLIDSKDLRNDINDKLVQVLALIFDLNYEYSLKLLKKSKLISKFKKIVNNKIFDEYFDEIEKYLKEK